MWCDGVEFTFVATEPISQDRLDMGYADMNRAYPFVLRSYDEGGEAAAMALAREADVMIFGAAPHSYLDARMALGKLTLYFCERPLKKGYWRRFIPMTYKKIYNGYLRYKDKPLYVLGASAYASYDLGLCGFDTKKCFRWGYFPQIKQRDVEPIIEKKRENARVKLLYAGRLLRLKRVIDFVKAAKLLRDGGVSGFELVIIGEGEERERIEKFVSDEGLSDVVTLLPFMSADAVRDYMDTADVYLFGSDFNEGWGAVVNEAMASACATVVSHAVGSAPYLIKDGENGRIYECKNVRELSGILKRLIEEPEYREGLARRAFRTVLDGWSAPVAAQRLVRLCESILSGEDTPYTEGVCSVAEPIKNGWIKKTNKH